LSQRIAANRSSPKDLLSLTETLALLPSLYELLNLLQELHPAEVIKDLLADFDVLKDCTKLLHNALVPDPPNIVTEGGLFQTGYHAELDHIIDLVNNGEEKLQAMLNLEREKSNLPKLKLGYNRVFGYYFELSKAQADKLPAHFIRRQSLANGERYTTEALKELEEALLEAAEKRKSLEFQLFQELKEKIARERERLMGQAKILAQIDYFQALATVGRTYGWVFPSFCQEACLELKQARHPVLEDILGRTNFVPNDFALFPKHNFCLLTGPNMSGKSTILRQTALIVILAQMGSMVPAASAKLGLVDKLFSRVGASDNLAQGESTFMVEMKETARILRQSTKSSLVILDEIGRGTSTYDGVALAWAIVEYLVKRANSQIRTIFATHYHELTELEGRLPEVFTMNVAIREDAEDIVFLHKLIFGPTDKSYGLEVARLAGVPASVIERARELLPRLEKGQKSMQEAVRTMAQDLLPGVNVPKAAQNPKNKPKTQAMASDHPFFKALQELDPE
ncbi:MAG: DNA mismatch repair protein MutS, partial [Desulfovibrio sp.]|nr:DNA mismatch repair protein MutS [Desulfovibrio sp.]